MAEGPAGPVQAVVALIDGGAVRHGFRSSRGHPGRNGLRRGPAAYRPPSGRSCPLRRRATAAEAGLPRTREGQKNSCSLGKVRAKDDRLLRITIRSALCTPRSYLTGGADAPDPANVAAVKLCGNRSGPEVLPQSLGKQGFGLYMRRHWPAGPPGRSGLAEVAEQRAAQFDVA